MKKNLIITWTSPDTGNKFVRTEGNNWAYYYPGINDYMWARFSRKADAEAEMKKSSLIGMTIELIEEDNR